MKNQTKFPMMDDEDDINELVTTNKSLAMEKRDLHRKKLRAYS